MIRQIWITQASVYVSPSGRPLRYEASGACVAQQADLCASRRQGAGRAGVRRAVTEFTTIEESAARPPDIPAPRAVLRSKLRIGDEETTHLPNV